MPNNPILLPRKCRKLKKPKPIKRKVFEKDTDEQFIVICNPFRQGTETQDGGKWRSRDANIISEWLRRALGSTGKAVSSIFVVSKVRVNLSR